MRTIKLLLGSLLFMPSLILAKIKRIQQDSVGVGQNKLKKTDVDVVYNHYMQDGNNSAVTGGRGTEALTVYSPSLFLRRSFGNNALSIKGGVDIVSSASTDNIDDVVSSASSRDGRYYGNITYERTLKSGLSVYGGPYLSIESDYLSVGGTVGFRAESHDRMRTYSARMQVFGDDLRWGRLSKRKDVIWGLVYPFELREKLEGVSIPYRRNSFDLNLGFTQVLNQRNVLGINAEIDYQEGLLSTPFHRVYFIEKGPDSLRIEKLPSNRFKAGLSIVLNSFIGGRVILKNRVQLYGDTFGILASGLESEIGIKISPVWVLLPNFRLYVQQGTPYFKPYKEHTASETFYTSDYDLSTMASYGGGMGIKFLPPSYQQKALAYSTLILRYNYLHQSRNLTAHTISLAISLRFRDQPKRGLIVGESADLAPLDALNLN